MPVRSSAATAAPARARRSAVIDAPVTQTRRTRVNTPDPVTSEVDESAYEDDDEDDAAPRRLANRGWGDAKKALAYDNIDFKVLEEDSLIKFLDPEPYASYKTHWVQNAEGKKSFTCLETPACPICRAGMDDPTKKIAFEVLVLTEDPEPKTYLLQSGIKLARKIQKLAEDTKRKGLTDGYYKINKTVGVKKTDVEYEITHVKPRDLPEDWNFSEEDARAAVEDAKRLPDTAIRFDSEETLRTVADKYIKGKG